MAAPPTVCFTFPAIAHEIGMDFKIPYANEISARTPNLCHLAPAGPTYMEDLNEAGGVYAVMNELNKKGLLNTDCMTVYRKEPWVKTLPAV